MSVSVITTSFGSGELSPRLGGRVDLAKYSTGLDTLKNMITHPHGGVSRRSGLRFIHEVKGRNLVPDLTSQTLSSSVFSFQDKLLSCAKDGQMTVPLELVAGKTYELKLELDKYISGKANISIGDTALDLNFNEKKSVRFQASDKLLNIKCLNGANFRFKFLEVREINPKARLIPFEFSTEQTYVLEFTDSNIRIYKDKGLLVDDKGKSVEIETPYKENDLDKIKFTQSADIMYLVHPEIQPYKLSRTSHTDWNMQFIKFLSPPAEWNSENGYPSCVTFFEERLCFAASPLRPQTVWMSKSGAYEDFSISDPLVDDDACTYTLSADQVNAIKWMISSKKLIMGTSGGEWWLTGGSRSDSVTPNSVLVRRETTHGSAALPPVVVGGVMIFLQREGKTIRELAYSFEADGYVAPDLTILAEHLTRKNRIVAWDYQQAPDSIVWMIRDDGKLLGLTYQREHQVMGFHQHETMGKFKSLCVINGKSGEELWTIVERTIEGKSRKYVELMEEQFCSDSSADGFFVDSGLSYNKGVSDDLFIGLDHLEGESVSVLADGAVHPDLKVKNGQIKLNYPAKKVSAGLKYDSKMKTLRLELQTVKGTSQGKKKRISHVTVRLFETLGFLIGYDDGHLERIPFRTSNDKLGVAPSLYSGDYKVKFNRGYDRDGQICILQDQPLPLTVLAVIPEFSVYS